MCTLGITCSASTRVDLFYRPSVILGLVVAIVDRLRLRVQFVAGESGRLHETAPHTFPDQCSVCIWRTDDLILAIRGEQKKVPIGCTCIFEDTGCPAAHTHHRSKLKDSRGNSIKVDLQLLSLCLDNKSIGQFGSKSSAIQ